MGCIYSKVIYLVNNYVLKQLIKTGKQLLGAARSFSRLKSEGNKENVAGSRLKCMMASNSFLKLYNEQCVPYGKYSVENVLLRALGVSDFRYKEISIRFEEKSHSEQEGILIFLYTNWQNLQQYSSVIEALKKTNFVTSSGGGLYKPRDLFDPGDSLLTSIFPGEVHRFPGKTFTSNGWLDVLRKTGLQNTSDADIILECARRVELLGAKSMNPLGLVDDSDEEDSLDMIAGVSLEIWSLAETLINMIIENFSILYSNKFCNILGKIAFVPAEIGFPFEIGRKGGKKVLCSYSEAILLKDWALAWSAAPILSRESLVPPDYSWEALQLTSPPPFARVLKHLQADELHTASSLLTIEDAIFEILQYLERIWSTLSSSDVWELQETTFIPVANRTYLSKPYFILSHATTDLSPLAFQLPSRYLPFVRILKDLGLHDKLSYSSAMFFLSSLKQSSGNDGLSPNELRAVVKILHILYDEIIEEQISDRSHWQSLLVVPDDSCRLVDPNSCVYIDPYGSRYHVKYIDSSKLRFVHPDISERLCLAIGIRKLSDVVVEELYCDEHLQNLEEIGSVSLSAIKQKLLSLSCQVAVFRVFTSVSSNTIGYEYPDFQTVQRSLESVSQRLQFVQCIYTRFWLLPKSLDITQASKESMIPEWESKSSHRALYYIDRSCTCMLIAEPPNNVSVLDLVSVLVSYALGSLVPLPIASLFLCPLESETALVNIMKLCYDERLMDGIMGSGIGFLGRDILPQDAMQVKLNPLRPFYKGEIVAWQINNGDKLKYGRIPEDVRPSTGEALYRFNIETSPGKTQTMISSHVFWFGNLSIGYESSTHLMPKEGDIAVHGMFVEQLQRSAGVKLRNQQQPTKELEHGRVSNNELIQAVEEVLSVAGIRRDTEKQCLLQTIFSLQKRLKESKESLMLEQKKSEIARNEADKAKAPLLCRVCWSNKIDIVVVPCGHVLCHQCSCDVSRCPFCRVQLSKTIKMYRF